MVAVPLRMKIALSDACAPVGNAVCNGLEAVYESRIYAHGSMGNKGMKKTPLAHLALLNQCLAWRERDRGAYVAKQFLRMHKDTYKH